MQHGATRHRGAAAVDYVGTTAREGGTAGTSLAQLMPTAGCDGARIVAVRGDCGRASHTLEALIALGTLHALVPLEALGSSEALIALGTLHALVPLEALYTPHALVTLEALRTLDTLRSLEALVALRALEALIALGTLHALIALEARVALRALIPLEALRTLDTLHALVPLEALVALRALKTLRAGDRSEHLVRLSLAELRGERTRRLDSDDLVFARVHAGIEVCG